ncbi:EAL domain, c-di-GMP-specific phosphodiesterase class I (or its enzymatically inactive variant) [Alkalithermobacter thermoalcaliphilus JW-YL-7 = DSM 7308]|uniref:Diguanylate cyclase/phosphodiesterase n=1 Tax=Alkalithermobacter thermoalcaliphilus JW-YL-7 = DSM 7308 TaxID=1121328 RepID=A0A150FSU2_CLOPD|nr:diguanylate cyclase/phosphodiesterase [[Clostridium] paradoxum JW-YL-7 = DSM 7308]SHL18185.1 EAL domain, c-di-GMP-specific phosphodiesterase class I (or its enzymatically inactive variant) [[Clostridium] paradoxum JW-YL-7 = DSM 7308]
MKDINGFMSNIKKKDSKNILKTALFIGLLLVVQLVIIHFSKEKSKDYIHFIYIPIMVLSLKYGYLGAILGIVLVLINTQDPLVNISFALFGLASSTFSNHIDSSKKGFEKENEVGLRNFNLMSYRIKQLSSENKKFTLFSVALHNHNSVALTFGIEKSDEFITRAFNIIKKNLPENLDIYRFYTNRFYILSENTSKSFTEFIVNTITSNLQQPVLIDDIPISFHPHIGIAYSLTKEDALDISRKATIASEKAIEKGKNYVIYNNTQDTFHKENFQLLWDFQRALERKELKVYYQPKINLKTLKCEGFEALIRWEHPKKGFISPMVFIPLIENTTLIQDLTKFVIEEVFKKLAQWKKSGINKSIAVNLSSNNIEDDSILLHIESLLNKYDINLDNFHIEITENTIINDFNTALAFLENVRNKGIKVSIDDFGTGYSSLNYLNLLPVDYIKIDHKFTKESLKNSKKKKIIEHIITLSHDLDMRVVVEGVENEELLENIHKMRADFAQGYYFSKPIPEEEMDIWLQEKAFA